MPGDSKPRSRPRYKMMSKAEQEALAQQQESERQAAIAFHHGKSREECPFAESNDQRQNWLRGFDKASRRGLRGDMTLWRAKGHNAFKDGLRREDCPLGGRTTERTEWLAGWEEARVLKEKHDDEHYR